MLKPILDAALALRTQLHAALSIPSLRNVSVVFKSADDFEAYVKDFYYEDTISRV